MKTAKVTPSTIKKNWIVVDAKDKVLGRLSSRVASVLAGKTKPNYVPHLDNGDYVIVINADKIKLTGNKLRDKMYYSHSGYIGNLRAASAGEILEKYPERILESSIKGMLPKNKLGRKMFLNLKVYKGAEHPHSAQNPQTIEL